METQIIRPATAGEALPKADQLFRDGLWKEALAEYRKQVDASPVDIAALIGVGRCALALGDHEAAADALTRALKLQPGDTPIMIYLAEADIGLSQWAQAKDLLGTICGLPDATAHAHYLHARVFFQEGAFADAAQCLRKALEVDPSYAAAAQYLGQVIEQSVTSGSTGNRVMPDLLKEVGFYHLRRDHKTLALGLFQQAAKLDVRDTQMYLTMGRHLGEEALYTQAILAYEQAVRSKPDNHDLLAGMAIVTAAKGNAQMALDFINQSIALAPGRADFHLYRGDLMFTLGQLQEALRSYEQARTLEPEDPTGHFSLGTVFFHMGEEEKALTAYQTAIQLNSAFSVAYLNLVTLNERRGHYGEALRHLKRFRELAPEDVRGPVKALSLLVSQERYRQALAAGREACERFGKESGLLLNMGVAALGLKEEEEAAKLFQQALQANPEESGALVNLGVIARRHDDTQTARALYEKAIEIDPACSEAHYNLGLADFLAGDHQNAAARFLKAIEADIYFGEAYHNLGVCYQLLGHSDEAEPVFARALELKAAAPGTHLGLGQSLQKQEKLEEALETYHKLVADNPSFEQAHDLLMSIWEIHRKQKNLDRAKKALEGALFMSPDDPDVHLAMGVTHHEADEAEEARKQYDETLRLDPANIHARANLAVYSCDVEKDPAGAVTRIKELLAESPALPEVQFNLGIIEGIQGNSQEALTAFQKAIAIAPEMYEAYLARSQIRLGEDLEADLKDLKMAVEANPKSIVTWINLGVVQAQLKMYDDALASTERALMLDESCGVVHFNRAVILDWLNDPQGAENSYKRAIGLDNDPDYEFNLAELHERLGRSAEAKFAYLATARRYPRYADSKVNAARLYRLEGGLKEAIDLLSDAVASRPRDPVVLSNWAVTLLAAREIPRAREAVKNLLAAEPDRAESHLVEGVFHQAQGEHERALESFGRALAIDPKLAPCRFHRTHSLIELDRVDEALEESAKLLELAPDEVRTHLIRAMIHVRRGDAAAQEDSLRQARELDPDDPDVGLAMARLLLDEERYPEAICEFEKLAHHVKLRFRIEWGLGEACFALDRFEEAAAHFAEAAPPGSTDPEPPFNRALALDHAGRVEEALRVLESPWLVQHVPSLVLKGRLLLRDDPQAAIAPLERALESDDELVEARFNLAAAYLQEGRPADALATLDHPSLDDLPAAPFQRGLAADDLGDLDRAVFEYRRAVRAGFPEAYLNLGLVRRRQREYQKELAAYRQAARRGVHLPTVRILESQAHLLRGRVKKALVTLAEADHDDPLVLALEGAALVHLGRGEQAIAVLSRAREAWPDDPDLIHNLACACAIARRPDPALETLAARPARRWTGAILVRAILTELKEGGGVAGDELDAVLESRAPARAASPAAPDPAAVESTQGLIDRFEKGRAFASLAPSLRDAPHHSDPAGAAVLWTARGNLAARNDPERAIYAYLKALRALKGPPPPYLLANLGSVLLTRSHPWASLAALSEVTGVSSRRLRLTTRARPITDNARLLHALRVEYGPRFPAAWLLPPLRRASSWTPPPAPPGA